MGYGLPLGGMAILELLVMKPAKTSDKDGKLNPLAMMVVVAMTFCQWTGGCKWPIGNDLDYWLTDME